MNNYYTFTGQPFNSHFYAHKLKHERKPLLKIIPEHYCHLCFPHSNNITIEVDNLINWFQERGAVSGSLTTELIFEEILNTRLNLSPEEFKRKTI